MKLNLRGVLQIKSYFKRSHHALSILFHIDILRGYQFGNQAFKSKACFEQGSSRDPKVFLQYQDKKQEK